MATDSDLTTLTAAEMAAALAGSEVSAVELTKAHLARINETDVQVRAFLHVASHGALAAARAVDELGEEGNEEQRQLGVQHADDHALREQPAL